MNKEGLFVLLLANMVGILALIVLVIFDMVQRMKE